MEKDHSSLKRGIIDHIKNYKTLYPESIKPPCIDTCVQHFHHQYSREEITDVLDELIDEGIVLYYSFHGYLTLSTVNTETFKSRNMGD
ncbi:MAG: hypothetical protein ACW98I_21080 [Candidatus Hodarchaeales archaeon]|jgi:hypothetical protein